MQQARKVFVTGANGHVGNNLVKALLERGYEVRASVRDANDPAKARLLPMGDIEWVSLDVRDERQFVEAKPPRRTGAPTSRFLITTPRPSRNRRHGNWRRSTA